VRERTQRAPWRPERRGRGAAVEAPPAHAPRRRTLRGGAPLAPVGGRAI